MARPFTGSVWLWSVLLAGVTTVTGSATSDDLATGQSDPNVLTYIVPTNTFAGPFASTSDIVVVRSAFPTNTFFRVVYDGTVRLNDGANAVQVPARVWFRPFDTNTEVLVAANTLTPELRGSGTINTGSSRAIAVFSGALTGARSGPGIQQSFNGRYDVVFEQPGIGSDPLSTVSRRSGLAVSGTTTTVQGSAPQQATVQGGGVLTRQPINVGGVVIP